MSPRWMLAVSLSIGCGNAGGFPDAALPDAPSTGAFSLTWSVVDQNSRPLACSRIGGQTMTVLARNREFDGGATQIFTCSSGMGQSQAVPAGVYDLSFELGGTVGLLATATPQSGVEVAANAVTPLAPLVFPVQAIGSLELQLASGKAGGNCGMVGAGGAGITAMTISLTRNSDGACVPVTFMIGQATMYTVNCTTAPLETACIEADQVLFAPNVPSDDYTIRIRGKIGATDCWINNDSILVPPLGKTLTRTLNLAHQSQTPGCS